MEQTKWKSIFDEDTFVQTFAYSMPGDGVCAGDGVLTGYGAAFGRLAFAAVQSSEAIGSIGAVHASKIAKTIEMATKHGAPFLLFMQTSGGRMDEGLDVLAGYGAMMQALSNANDEIPTICVIRGDCFGASATIASMFDFVIMIKNQSHASAVTAVTEENREAATGTDTCSANGFASFVCSEDDLCDVVRHLFDFLPDNSTSGTEDYDGSTDDWNRPCSYCASILPDTSYDVRDVICELADYGDFLEIWSDFATAAVTGFARFGGRVIGVISNQSTVNEGKINEAVCRKIVMMIDYCDRFNIPLLTLTNCNGILNNLSDEQNGLSAATGLLASAFIRARVPKLNLIIGNAFGNGAILMNSREVGADYVFAWEQARISVTNPEVAALMVYRDEIAGGTDASKARLEAINKYKELYCLPIYAAQKGYIDDIIPAVQTRARIISVFQMM